MFWKGAVHTWLTCSRLNLGVYGGPIREFLLGEGPFPQNITLIVRVVASEEPPWTTHLPIEVQRKPCHLFSFYLRGIDFTLAVGKQIPTYLRHVCLYTNPLHPVVAGLHVGEDELKLMKGLVEKSKPSRKLAEFFKGPRPQKKR